LDILSQKLQTWIENKFENIHPALTTDETSARVVENYVE